MRGYVLPIQSAKLIEKIVTDVELAAYDGVSKLEWSLVGEFLNFLYFLMVQFIIFV